MATRVQLDTVIYEEVAPRVVLVTLNRPDDANGVTPELARDLETCLNRLEPDFGVGAIVLTGAGQQFSGGADLKAMRRYLDEELPRTEEPYNARWIYPVTQRIAGSRLPVIAAVNGGATAGGLDLALACDIRVASNRAKFGETYIKIGLPPGNGGSYFLPRLVGSGMAAELALTGDVIGAERALEIGLVNRVCEPDALLDEAVGLAAKIAARPWRAVQATKQGLRSSWHTDLQGSFALSFWSTSALHFSRDLVEGIDAFIEKREPQFGVGEDDDKD